MLTELDRQDTDTSGDHTAYPYLGLDTLADNLQGESALEPFPKLPPAYPLRIVLSSVFFAYIFRYCPYIYDELMLA